MQDVSVLHDEGVGEQKVQYAFFRGLEFKRERNPKKSIFQCERGKMLLMF